MQLSQILDGLPDAAVDGPTDLEITDVAYNSRLVQPGSMFVAVPSIGGGSESGGYRFIGDAARLGARAVVVETGPNIPGVTTIRVPSTRRALGELAAAFYNYPSRSLQLYAVTGTDGKTTTTYLLEQILNAAGLQTGLVGTVEIKIGERRERNLDRMTTPESLDLQRLLRSMVDAGVTHAAMEASSHALALERVRGCEFAACGFTNITADHVEFHGSWEAYFEAKARLFTEYGRAVPAVLNRDDSRFTRLVELVEGPLLTYSMSGSTPMAEVAASDVRPADEGTAFRLHIGDDWSETTIRMPGDFNVANALCAAGLAHWAGLTLRQIAEGLRRAQAPPGRFQRVTAGQPFEVLVDYAHTVHAFHSVLNTLRRRNPEGRIIAVFGATGDRDRKKRPLLAQIAREHTDFFFITNEDPYSEEPRAIMDEVASGVPAGEKGVRYECEEDRAEAIRRALRCAAPGDTVVMLGKGHEQSMVVAGAKEPWSDLTVAQRALEELY